MKSKIIIKSSIILLVIFLIFYFGFQIFNSFKSPYKTKTVKYENIVDYIDVQGLAIRDEQYITSDKSGSIRYYFENGSKVSNGSEIASIYPNEKDIIYQDNVNYMNKLINILENLKSSNNKSQLDSIINQINKLQEEITGSYDKDNFTDFEQQKLNFYKLQLQKQMLINNFSDIDGIINKINSKKKQIENLITEKFIPVFTDRSGYISNNVDGYEYLNINNQEFNYDNLINLFKSPSKQIESNVIGKIVNNFDWKFVIQVDGENINKFNNRKSVKLQFTQYPDLDIDVNIEQIIKQVDNKTSFVILSSDIITPEILNLRFEQAKVVFSNYSGIALQKDMIRILDGEKGVYVINGSKILFKKIDIIFENKDLIVSKYQKDKNEYVEIYDDVIIEGKDLYNGKLIS